MEKKEIYNELKGLLEAFLDKKSCAICIEDKADYFEDFILKNGYNAEVGITVRNWQYSMELTVDYVIVTDNDGEEILYENNVHELDCEINF